MYYGGGHLGFPIGIKNINFVEDLPMIIPGEFGFNCPSDFREEPYGKIVSKRFFSETKLPRNDHWKVLCFLCRSEIQDGCHHRTISGKYNEHSCTVWL
jgi:hypothetical protein